MDRKTLFGNDVTGYLTAVADGGVEAPALLMVHGANFAYTLPNPAPE